MSARLVAGLLSIAAGIATAAPAVAAYPKRTFYCGDGDGRLIVTVLSQQQIKVSVHLGGDDGDFTMTMNKQGAGYQFVDGEYVVKITNAQDSLTYTAPDYGTTSCKWSGH